MAGHDASGGARAPVTPPRGDGRAVAVAARPVGDGELSEHASRLFAPGAVEPDRVRTGVELELIPVRGRPPRPVPLRDTRGAIVRHDPALLGDACISFEPGGQVELSPPPQASLAALLDLLDGLVARLDGALARDGIVAVSSGLNPWHVAGEVGLQLDAERYTAMQRHFDAIGSAGRDMMRLTAGLQVCVDLLPGDAGIEQWLLANRVGPALCAAFANSAVGGGMLTGWSGTRCLLWRKLDGSRTGFDGTQVSGADPAHAYARFAAEALAMPLSRDPAAGDAAAPARSFAAWQGEGAGGRPDHEDLDHHLSTLFPPVRPRGGYLEVRYLDTPPRRCVALPLLVVDTLLREPRARATALAALGDVDRATLLAMWDASAHQGVVNPWLRSEAHLLLALTVEALGRLRPGSVPRGAASALRAFTDDHLCRRRCWSDDQAERIDGPDAEDPTAWT